MLDAIILQQLRRAVKVEDWILAADVCLELALAAPTPLDRARAEELAKAVRLCQTTFILDTIDGLKFPPV